MVSALRHFIIRHTWLCFAISPQRITFYQYLLAASLSINSEQVRLLREAPRHHLLQPQTSSQEQPLQGRRSAVFIEEFEAINSREPVATINKLG
jgi:hypothetical protein